MEITGKTSIMFVLADPVGHVRATAVMNDHFRSIGVDVAVSPLHVSPEHLGQVLGGVRRMRNVVGFGVTIPHKVAVIPHLDGVTPQASAIGAVNFVRRDEDGRLFGDNMDAPGFIAGLARHDVTVEGKKVLQVGAGGAGRATAFAMAGAGVRELTIMNRDRGKAAALAEAVARSHPGLNITAGTAPAGTFDLVVNTTSLGMKAGDPLPVDIEGITPDTIVSDIIVNPPITPLLERAAANGARIVGGKAMLDEQMSLVARFIKR